VSLQYDPRSTCWRLIQWLEYMHILSDMAKNRPIVKLTAKVLDETLRRIYYVDGGFQGISALHSKLRKGEASKERVRKWISQQEVGRYMQTKPPKEIFARFTENRPNAIHQADLLFLPHDRVGRRTYKYALTLVDVASRYKAARPLTSKLASEVANAFASIYKDGPLTYPKTLMVDDGHEFKGAVTKLLGKYEVRIR
jgi:IS30 family transposase